MDLTYALRTLWRQPGFSVAVALTLALGLGLNATVLGMMDALMLRPFQFADYERLVVVWETHRDKAARDPVAPANFVDWREESTRVNQLTAWEGWGPTLTGGDDPERLQGFRVSPGFFEVLGIQPVAGRTFSSDEDQVGRHRRVVIGDGLWKRRFGADASIVGGEILLDGEPHTVVGIAPPGFDFPVGSEAWAPLAFAPDRRVDRKTRSLTVLGKLAPGASVADAQVELETISRRLEQQYPATNRDRTVSVRTLSTAFREDGSASFVGILQVGAGLVLLIACANLAGLLLARATDRQREIAVRTALGATRARIVRQLVTETVLLGLAASVLALLLARVGLDVIRSSVSPEIARHVEGWNNLRLDSRLVFLIPLLAIAAGLLAGLFPALSASRASLTAALKDGDRGAVGGRRRQRVRQALVVAEIAFALALLVAASLAMQGGIRLVNQSGGFDSARLLSFDIPLPATRYGDADVRREFANDVLLRLSAVPGVDDVALANVLPAAGWSPSRGVMVDGDPVQDSARWPRTGFRSVSAGYFEAMRIPIVKGRSFSSFDRERAQQVAIVSAAMAERFWPGIDPVGQRLRLENSQSNEWLTVIGVAGDVTMYNWWDGVDFQAVYRPLSQAPPEGGVSAVIRTRGEPASFTSAVRQTIRTIDPQLPIDGVRTMQQAISDSTFGLDYLASLMAVCGAIALFLSAVGIYSMMAYAISQRTHEFGVRMALGATARDVLRLTLSQAAALTALGIAIGLGLALLLGRLMASALYGVIALNASTFAVVGVALALVACAAAYLPARRSATFDPATILRGQ